MFWDIFSLTKRQGCIKFFPPPPRNQRPKWRGKEGKREGKREGIGEGKGKCREGSGQVGKEIGREGRR